MAGGNASAFPNGRASPFPNDSATLPPMATERFLAGEWIILAADSNSAIE